MMQERIFVVGHRNPDTDSVCSALAYARLRSLQGVNNVIPARAGYLNRQTEFVLESLGVEPPRLLSDVVPRVGDVVKQPAVTIHEGAPLAWALDLLHRHNIGVLPVIDKDGRALGLLFLRQVAERFLVAGQEGRIRQIQTSPLTLARCLGAEVLNHGASQGVEDLDLYVGAMAYESFCHHMEGLDPGRLLVVTGDREDIQRHAASLGVRLLVITGGQSMSVEVLETARKNGVTVLATAYDTATTASLVRLSTPVECLMSTDFATAGMDESLEALRYRFMDSAQPGVLVLDGTGRVVAVATKSTLLAPLPIKLMLVDHNELSQAVPGADRVEILEIIDHHRLANIHTDAPIRFVNQPLGSTCSIVADLYKCANMLPDPQTAGLLLAGLLSDTVLLRSPTSTDIDRELCVWLADLAKLDPQEFGGRMFAAGSALAAYGSMKELILADFKEYTQEGRRFGVGQVEVVSFDEFQDKRSEIALSLGQLCTDRALDLGGLLVTDIVRATSLLLLSGNSELIGRVGYPRLDTGLYELKGVLSRKKQLLPHLLKILKA
jgi:manganese-dependent inorganic pyrophosphatase